MAEQLRKQKQDELVKLGQEIQFENHSEGIGGLEPESNASPIAYLSDPRNYQAIREKQALLEREKTMHNKKNRMALQGQHQMEVEKLT